MNETATKTATPNLSNQQAIYDTLNKLADVAYELDRLLKNFGSPDHWYTSMEAIMSTACEELTIYVNRHDPSATEGLLHRLEDDGNIYTTEKDGKIVVGLCDMFGG